jgi:hypothetical protein
MRPSGNSSASLLDVWCDANSGAEGVPLHEGAVAPSSLRLRLTLNSIPEEGTPSVREPVL